MLGRECGPSVQQNQMSAITYEVSMACDSLRVMCHEICGLQRGDRPRTVDRIKAHSQNGDIQFHSISAEEKRNLWLIMATRRAVAPETRGMISGLS